VFACALIGLRWRGRAVGLMAAAAAASTPIFVSMFGHPMEDGLLTMSLAVAVLWWQRAVLTKRWWPLLWAGLFIGVGFQAKMMQAWFVLPPCSSGP
jgi:4-amino-4-deoxy-L-arabinose transferase-like glycosyltransferase